MLDIITPELPSEVSIADSDSKVIKRSPRGGSYLASVPPILKGQSQACLGFLTEVCIVGGL